MIKKKNKNFKNIIVGLLSQLIILLMGFVVPRIIMIHYGSDINGLTNTIVQVFTYLALLQGGISQSTKNALYKPINDNNRDEISLVLSSSKKYFKKVTMFYSLAVLLLCFSLPFMLKTSVNYWTVFFIIFFEGFTEVISFYFINTLATFLTATGKDYVKNSIELFGKTLCYSVKIVLALLGVNIAIIQFGYFMISLLKTVIYYCYIKSKYNWISFNKETNGYKLPDRNSFVVAEIAWTIFSSTDMIILSSFVSTALSSVYSVYNLVYVAISNLLSSVFYSLTFNLGIRYNKDRNEYTRLHDIFQSVFVGSMTSLMCITYVLIIPFVSLYTKSVKDVDYIVITLPVLFCLVQILSWSRYVQGTLIGIAGYARKVVKVSIIEAVLNVILSILLVSRFGITGVLIATVSVLPIKIIYSTYLADIVILKRSCKKTLEILFGNYGLFFLTIVAKKYINVKITNYFSFIIYGIIFSLIFFLISICVNYIINPNIKDVKLLLK